MNFDFRGRVAIVTGAGNGLGRDYALNLAARGASVVVNNRAHAGEPSSAEAVVEQIRAAGGIAVANHDPVGTRSTAQALIDATMDSFGRIDIVINNAGNQANSRFEDMTEEEFDDVMTVHVKGAFHISQMAYRVMMKQGVGRFLFTSSASSLFGLYLRANYATAKAAVIGLANAVGLEGERFGILANVLMPLGTGTSGRLGKAKPQAHWPDWEARLPTSRPAEMAALAPFMSLTNVTPLVLYLCSEQCKTTRAIYSAAGGRYARVFIGATQGWMSAGGTTPEAIAENFAAIEDRRGFEEYSFITEELLSIARKRQDAAKRTSD